VFKWQLDAWSTLKLGVHHVTTAVKMTVSPRWRTCIQRVEMSAAGARAQRSQVDSCWNSSDSLLPTFTCHDCVASRSQRSSNSRRNRSRSGSRIAASSSRRKIGAMMMTSAEVNVRITAHVSCARESSVRRRHNIRHAADTDNDVICHH